MVYAHSPNGAGAWHDLEAHLRGTAERARVFAEPFGGGEAALGLILAGIVMVGYAHITGVVFVLCPASTTCIQRLRSRSLCSSLGQHH